MTVSVGSCQRRDGNGNPPLTWAMLTASNGAGAPVQEGQGATGMSTHQQWLRREVTRWRAEGLVDETLAARILARYPSAPERGWGRLAFSAIGAGLIGLGVTLFFAYNWDDIPKAVKLALVFAALAAAHAGAMLESRRPNPRHGLVEGLHVLGTMLFGAGIWLVAQIYHIDEHYPNAFLTWSLGALGLAWALPSLVQGMLALALIGVWAGVEVFDFRAPMHAAPVLVTLGALPLAWWRRSAPLLFCGVAVLVLVTAFGIGWIDDKALLPVLLMGGGAAMIAGLAAPGTAFPAAEGPLRGLGLLVVLGSVYVLSFRGAVGVLGKVDVGEPGVAIYLGAAGVALAGAATLLGRWGLTELDRTRRWQLALLGLTLAVVLVSVLSRRPAEGWPLALAFNAIALGFGALLILDGSERLDPWLVGGGCLVFALVTISRYTDLFSSLLARAGTFVALGAGLFLVGNFYARQRRRAEEVRP